MGVLALFAFALPTKKKITIWMVGDSTMANKSPKAYPETGWGMAFAPFFDKDVKVDNRALNGRSTKSFINEKRWQPILDSIQPGDYVFIEFGHNDEKVEKPAVGTSLDSFRIYLSKYVNETRSKQGIPILLTPITRRSFKDGVLTNSHGDYPAVVKAVADSLKVPMIDMLAMSSEYVTSLGVEKSKILYNYVDSGNANYPTGKKDDTHFSPVGAQKMAELAASAIRDLHLPLADRLVKQR